MKNKKKFIEIVQRRLNELERDPSWLAKKLNVHPSTVFRWLDETYLTLPGHDKKSSKLQKIEGLVKHLELNKDERQVLVASVGLIYEPQHKKETDVIIPPLEYLEDATISSHNTAAIRNLLTQAIDDQELTILCFDYFHIVHQNFTTEMSRSQKIHLLIDYCEKHNQFTTLLIQIKKLNPEQYRNFVFSIQESAQRPKKFPLQLPTRIKPFIGRKHELTQLLADLQPGRMITLCGPGGIGKTALATEVIWQLTPKNGPPEQFPDGVIYYSFYNDHQVDTALGHILQCFAADPKPNLVTAAQHVLGGKQVLLFLDGTEDADDLPKILQVTGTCGVLITSRQKSDAPQQRQDIKPFSENEAITLLHQRSGYSNPEMTISHRICELIGRLPLAVQLVGRYLNETKEPLAEYLTWLEEAPLEALDPDEQQDKLKSTTYLLAHSIQQVNPYAQDILALVGQVALASFSQQMIAKVLQFPKSKLKLAFRQLTNYGLLQRLNENRYQVSHALIHTYARERMVIKSSIFEQLTQYYIHFAIGQRRKGAEGYHNLNREREHSLRLVDSCMKRKDWESIRALVKTIADYDGYLDIQGHWTDRIMMLAKGVIAAQMLSSRQDEGIFLGCLGDTAYDLGNFEEAMKYYEQALELSQKIRDQQNENRWLRNIGNIYSERKNIKQAIVYYKQALEISQKINDQRNEAANLGSLGNFYLELQQIEKAIHYYEQAITINQDQRYEAQLLGNLGLAHNMLNQANKAIDYCQQGLDICQKIQDRKSEAYLLGNLGRVHDSLNQIEQAKLCYKKGLIISQEIGDQLQEKFLLKSIERLTQEAEAQQKNLPN